MIGKNTRTLILDATIKLLTEKNILDITTRSIAKEAGVSKGTLFHYFKTKDSLLYYAVEKIYLNLLDNILQIVAQTPNEDVIRKVTYEILNFFGETPGMIGFLLSVINTINTKSVSQPSNNVSDDESTLTRESVVQNLLYPIYNESAKVFLRLGYEKPMIIGRLYLGIIDGIGFQLEVEKISKEDPLIEQFAEEIVKLFTI